MNKPVKKHIKKWEMRKHAFARCPVCGKSMASVVKAASTTTGTQRRILKCYNSSCGYETRS